MIFGSVSIEKSAVNTHRDSYRLENLSVVSVRRPLLLPAILFAVGLGGFAVAFADLLYAHESAALAALVLIGLVIGFWLGQLKLLSRDLRGSELSGVIWGTYSRLNKVRRDIVTAIDGLDRREGAR